MKKKLTRLEANLRVLDLIVKYCKRYPDQRFNQAIFNLDVVTGEAGSGLLRDEYYMESTELLKRVASTIKSNKY